MNEPKRIRVLAVDDHPLMREGISAIVRSQPDMEIVGCAGTGAAALDAFREHRPDVTLMDVRLPDMSGIAALEAIRAEFPKARVVMLSTFDGDVEVQRSLESGASGYLLKTMPPDELLAGVRAVHAGKKCIPPDLATNLAAHLSADGLTTRELEILEKVAEGLRNREVAEELAISEDTVKVHLRHIMEKLGARDRTEAVAIGIRRGFIHY